MLSVNPKAITLTRKACAYVDRRTIEWSGNGPNIILFILVGLVAAWNKYLSSVYFIDAHIVYLVNFHACYYLHLDDDDERWLMTIIMIIIIRTFIILNSHRADVVYPSSWIVIQFLSFVAYYRVTIWKYVSFSNRNNMYLDYPQYIIYLNTRDFYAQVGPITPCDEEIDETESFAIFSPHEVYLHKIYYLYILLIFGRFGKLQKVDV